MIEEVLNVEEGLEFVHKDKTYVIKPMNVINFTKAIKLLSLKDFDFNDLTKSVITMLGDNADNLIKVVHIASGIEIKTIENMMIDEIIDLAKKIVDVNKPRFFLAKEILQASIPKSELNGQTQSKHSSQKDTTSNISSSTL